MSDIIEVIIEASPAIIEVSTAPRGQKGDTGATGATGATGSAGIGYDNVTSTSNITIGAGLKTFTLVSSYAGAFTSGSRIRAIHSDTPTYWMEGYANYVGGGTLILSVDKFNGSGSHNLWRFSLAGEVGNTGATGAQGPSGVIGVTAPITNSGTSTSAQLGIDQSALALTQSQVTNLTADLAAKAPLASPTFTGTITTPLTTAGYVQTSATGVLSSVASVAQADVAGLVAALNDKASLTASNTFSGTQTITPSAIGNVPLVAKGLSGQTGDLTQWQNTGGSVLAKMDSSGRLTTVSGFATTLVSATTIGAVIRGAASQTANLQEWQDSAGTILARVTSGGAFFLTAPTLYAPSISAGAATNMGLRIYGSVSQTADLTQWQTSASAVLAGTNAVGQTFTGSTQPVTTQVGGTPTATTGTGTTATITLTSAPNVAVGDLIYVTGFTPTGYNSTTPVVVTAVSNTSPFSVSYANTTTGAMTVAGTVSTPAQASITARSAGTIGQVVRGAASQFADLQQWQTAGGAVAASINFSGSLRTPSIISADGSTAITLPSGRNVGLCAVSGSFGGGQWVISIGNAQTVPTSNPTGGGILYSEAGALKWRGPGGGITQIADATINGPATIFGGTP
jgi:hypothetical protein